jgi:hypothetical protein
MRWPTWADLRGIGNSNAVRASIIVPLIGYLIILNSTVADYLKLHGIEWVHEPASAWDRFSGASSCIWSTSGLCSSVSEQPLINGSARRS